MQRRSGWLALVLLTTAFTSLGSGCGPAISTPSINDAELAVETARLEQAETFATFEFVSAVEYLEKAKEEWSFSDFQHAEEYANRAIDFAEAALARAVANPDRSVEPTGREVIRFGDRVDDEIDREFGD